jgi:hypothetical protein
MNFTPRFRALGALVIAVGALGLTSTALAGLPKPGDPVIVPGESIGGVSIGQATSDAQAAWASTPRCSEKIGVCRYGTRKQGAGRIVSVDGVVGIVSIDAPFKQGEFSFKGPLMKFGTAEGDLGLGDKLPEVAARYPGGEKTGRSIIYKDGDRQMTFFSSDGNRGRRITSISLAPRGPARRHRP